MPLAAADFKLQPNISHCDRGLHQQNTNPLATKCQRDSGLQYCHDFP